MQWLTRLFSTKPPPCAWCDRSIDGPSVQVDHLHFHVDCHATMLDDETAVSTEERAMARARRNGGIVGVRRNQAS